MSLEKVQRAIDSIQVEQDILYRHFKAHKLLSIQFSETKDNYFFSYHSDSLYLIAFNPDSYDAWYSHWSLDSLKKSNNKFYSNHIADSLLIQKKGLIALIDSTQDIADSLNYDKIVYPDGELFKVFYLAQQENDSVFYLGIDYYFLIDKKSRIIDRKQFHKKVKPIKLIRFDEKRKEYVHSKGGGYIHIGDVPFIYATNIAKCRWYKTDAFESYGEFSKRNKRSFYYHFKDNKITIGR